MRLFKFFALALVGYLCGINTIYAQQLQSDPLGNIESSGSSLTADFSSNLTYTCVGEVSFQDLSANSPTNWLWQFGDGGLSTMQHPTYTYANSGTYTVSLQVTNSQGLDTIIKTAYVTVEKPEITSTINSETCLNSTATLSATNGTGVLQWYDGANTLVHTGPTFTTPSLIASTTYFVEESISSTTTSYAPPLDAATVGGGGYHGSNFTGGVNFTAYQAFDIVSVWVDADGTGSRTIYLYDGFVPDGNVTITNTIVGQVTVLVPDGQTRVQLNLQVPSAGDYCLGGNEMDMRRNNNGASYPYSVAGMLDKVSSTYLTDYYYYFYDWELATSTECISTREPVVAHVVDASFTNVINGGIVAFTDNSIGATSWLWDFGDGNSSSLQNPVYTYTSTNGPHNVTLTINNGLCSFSDSVTVSVGIEQIAEDMTLAIYPNPSSSQTTLSFSQDLPEDLNIELIGLDGRLLIETTMLAGQSSKILDVSALPPAMYLLRLFTSEIIDVRKIVVGR